jgi:hypothetical protein
MFRRLCNAVSVLCVVACIALVAMWVRSQWHADRLQGRLPGGRLFLLASTQGRVTAISYGQNLLMEKLGWQVYSHSVGSEYSFPIGSVRSYESALGFGWISNPLFNVEFTQQLKTLAGSLKSSAPAGNGTLTIGPPVGSVLNLSDPGFADSTSVKSSADGNQIGFSDLAIDIPQPGSSSGSIGQLSTFGAESSSASPLPAGSQSSSSTFARTPLTLNSWTTTGTLITFATPSITLMGGGLIVPYWCLVMLTGIVFAVLRIRRPWRFSLRSMMTAVTFVAIVLALSAVIDR